MVRWRIVGSRKRKPLLLETIARFLFPDSPRKTLLAWAIPLIFASYFGTLAYAAVVSPTAYDWRSRVISNLISPRNNPAFHWIPSIGIAIAGLLMIPFTSYIHARLRFASQVDKISGPSRF
jgi:hypothetical protein